MNKKGRVLCSSDCFTLTIEDLLGDTYIYKEEEVEKDGTSLGEF